MAAIPLGYLFLAAYLGSEAIGGGFGLAKLSGERKQRALLTAHEEKKSELEVLNAKRTERERDRFLRKAMLEMRKTRNEDKTFGLLNSIVSGQERTSADFSGLLNAAGGGGLI